MVAAQTCTGKGPGSRLLSVRLMPASPPKADIPMKPTISRDNTAAPIRGPFSRYE
jgi:hypothetical protein